jgi:hypothetical protein
VGGWLRKRVSLILVSLNTSLKRITNNKRLTERERERERDFENIFNFCNIFIYIYIVQGFNQSESVSDTDREFTLDVY